MLCVAIEVECAVAIKLRVAVHHQCAFSLACLAVLERTLSDELDGDALAILDVDRRTVGADEGEIGEDHRGLVVAVHIERTVVRRARERIADLGIHGLVLHNANSGSIDRHVEMAHAVACHGDGGGTPVVGHVDAIVGHVRMVHIHAGHFLQLEGLAQDREFGSVCIVHAPSLRRWNLVGHFADDHVQRLSRRAKRNHERGSDK